LEALTDMDGRRFSPSAGRNKEAIKHAFLKHMPTDGKVLEIGSGTGEHGIHITEDAPRLEWIFSDPDQLSVASIRAWIHHAGRANLIGPHHLDATERHWGALEALQLNGLFCANVIHISPFTVCEGLFAGASRLLIPGGRVFLYGPFGRNGHLSDGNQRFSDDLKRRDPSWGVRDLEVDVLPLAASYGFSITEIVEMPKNNLSIVLQTNAG
ncbi:MAG: DUF938 domain-containing protein, partial [Pseudomonadota bacterium]